MEKIFKLFDFNLLTNIPGFDDEVEYDEECIKHDNKKFIIQMFGIDESGETYSVIVKDFNPFFYVKVGDDWGQNKKNEFVTFLKTKLGKFYENSILECKLIMRKKLYGFDGGKEYKFVLVTFASMSAFNKVKNQWYKDGVDEDGESQRKLIPGGFLYKNEQLELYEGHVPPLLRFFHITEISPSGWVSVDTSKISEVIKTTTCNHEFIVSYKHLKSLNSKETVVPYKIMSFDIEASSSHGDFPIPIKSYKKLATNIVDKLPMGLSSEECICLLERMIKTAFNYDNFNGIELVYPKTPLTFEEVDTQIHTWIKSKVRDYSSKNNLSNEYSIESLFENMFTEYNKENHENHATNPDENIAEEERSFKPIQGKRATSTYENNQSTIVDILCDSSFDRTNKINELILSLRNNFPALEGDKVTFIGSTFVKYGQPEPYLNHCIVLNSCDTLEHSVPNSQIETYDTEREVLLAWTDLVQRENPDIVIGYNIFSFDYEFMFRRSQECNCVTEFLQLSRNIGEVCANTDYKTGKVEIEKSSITLASGTYDLSIIKMNGRFQVDMYNWFRRSENLVSYKLDYVGGYFIGDFTKSFEHLVNDKGQCVTRVHTKNMMGLQEQNYIHFEVINHSSDYYKDGAKFVVINVNKKDKWFEIIGHEQPKAYKIKWGLAKDDVTPKDIFRMTHEGPTSRAIIAKYCIQDCNLVHHLFNKVDVITDLVEMSRLCSVPMSFLVFRGQGIKLTSYVAKKCREKRTLIPSIDKGSKYDAYEGAIVLEPKCGLYLDNPSAVGDFASLYPSSMLSENLCPSSKVWKRIYDLGGNLIKEFGEKDQEGHYIYDNLPGYEYVDIPFDTYKYVVKSKTSNGPTYEKIKSGYAICRFAQPLTKNGQEEKAIMPAILQELLKARKDTRKMIPQQTDEFIKNVLDKRQLAYKVTANSLYGQLGAKTSTFYEPDVAASTTATGRLLLTYAKRVVEECYADTDVETKNYGTVHTKAEYIYGDTDSVFFTFNLSETNGTPIRGDKALEISIEVAQEACHMVSSFLKQPHDFEYEKTFMPFCLLSKKRYVGMLYETDPKSGKRKEMGIVLKRRDNAPIVKDIYGGCIDILMKEANIQKTIDFVDKSLQELVDKKVPMEKLIITKSLNSYYKNPLQIAHKVLADRIAARDPGNKPGSGDRIPFVYIVNNKKDALQGEKIETPNFIIENNVKIDYSFYITNQIMKPLLQLFGLILVEIWKIQKKEKKLLSYQMEIEKLKKSCDPDKFEDKLEKIIYKEVEELLFTKHLRITNNAKNGNQAITSFFTKK